MSTERSKNTILIVEDESPLRRALCDKFTREGFAVSEAKDGDTGLEVALREEPQVILLDMMMPKTDGIAMLKQLRTKNEWSKNVPVLLLTNVSSDYKRMLTELMDDGSVHYLVKSDWPISKLVTRVREAVAQQLRKDSP
jgi:DNA-binding response OmpR family regulator